MPNCKWSEIGHEDFYHMMDMLQCSSMNVRMTYVDDVAPADPEYWVFHEDSGKPFISERWFLYTNAKFVGHPQRWYANLAELDW